MTGEVQLTQAQRDDNDDAAEAVEILLTRVGQEDQGKVTGRLHSACPCLVKPPTVHTHTHTHTHELSNSNHFDGCVMDSMLLQLLMIPQHCRNSQYFKYWKLVYVYLVIHM